MLSCRQKISLIRYLIVMCDCLLMGASKYFFPVNLHQHFSIPIIFVELRKSSQGMMIFLYL